MPKFDNYNDLKRVKGQPTKTKTAKLKAKFEQQEQPRRTEPKKIEGKDVKAIKEKLYANKDKSFKKNYITSDERAAMNRKGQGFGRNAG